jgi:hypothetical protein
VDYVGHIGGVTLAVTVQDNFAYVGEGPRLTVLDVSVPGSPTVLGKTTPLTGIVSGVALAGGYAYVATEDAGLWVVDVSSLAAVGSYDTPGWAYGVAVAGGYAYVADGHAGLRVVNVSDPAHPTEVGFYDTPDVAFGVAVAAKDAYVANRSAGLLVLRFAFAHPSRVYLPLVMR